MIRCDTCDSTKIGVEEFHMYGTRYIPYCIPCSDRKKYPNLDKGETLAEHTHKWEARNGKYGGFVYCIKCTKTISAARDELLFRRVCTYRTDTIEAAISLAKASYGVPVPTPPPPIICHNTSSKTQSLFQGLPDDSGYNDVMHDWDEPGSYGGSDGGW